MIHLRGTTYHVRRRVPGRYASVEPRGQIWVSLHTDSPTVARRKADALWGELIEGWEARLAGNTADAEARFAAAAELARVRGHRYLASAQVAQLPIEELLLRVEAVPERRAARDAGTSVPDQIEGDALLGGVAEPPITLSRALEAYWDVARDKVLGKSDDQVRRWRNPRVKAIRNLVAVVGDKPLGDLTRDDLLTFRDWWVDRLMSEQLTPNSANKDLIHLGEVLRTVVSRKRLAVDLPLGDLSFREGEAGQRPSFSTEWLRERLLAPGALGGLNDEARCSTLAMVNTGARPSEVAGLVPDHIRLDDAVPHIRIEPEGRQLKSARARRAIPLLGVSLEALREMPGGFPRYRDKAGLSATVNKYLRAHGLCETPQHTLYSLHHAFEDRLLSVGVDERIRRDLLGHRLDRERYGAGATLGHTARVMAPAML